MRLRFFNSIVILVKSILSLGIFASLNGHFKCRILKLAQINCLFATRYLRHPRLQIFVPCDTGNSARVGATSRQVLGLLSDGYISQIFYSIVKAITVNMVYLTSGKAPIFNKPNEPMGEKILTLDAHLHVVIAVKSTLVASDHSYFGSIASRIFPVKQPRISMVAENFKQSPLCQFGFIPLSHCHGGMYGS